VTTLLEHKATEGEREDYRRFVLTVAGKVAAAHREKGKQVSPAEEQAIQDITTALGSGRFLNRGFRPGLRCCRRKGPGQAEQVRSARRRHPHRQPRAFRQVARLSSWAAQAGLRVARVEAEVGSGVSGTRAKARRLLADPAVTVVVVEHRDRLGRMNTELVESALAAAGRRMVVIDDSEVTDDLVRDMVEVLTSFCARLYGRRSARNRALKAVGCAQRDTGPQAAGGAGG
jgi:hypothetical protein